MNKVMINNILQKLHKLYDWNCKTGSYHLFYEINSSLYTFKVVIRWLMGFKTNTDNNLAPKTTTGPDFQTRVSSFIVFILFKSMSKTTNYINWTFAAGLKGRRFEQVWLYNIHAYQSYLCDLSPATQLTSFGYTECTWK